MVRTQNFVSPAARDSGTLGNVSDPRVSGRNVKFS